MYFHSIKLQLTWGLEGSSQLSFMFTSFCFQRRTTGAAHIVSENGSVKWQSFGNCLCDKTFCKVWKHIYALVNNMFMTAVLFWKTWGSFLGSKSVVPSVSVGTNCTSFEFQRRCRKILVTCVVCVACWVKSRERGKDFFFVFRLKRYNK